MRKRFIYVFLCFFFMFIFSSSIVNAKTYSDENVSVTFGNDNNLQMYYQGYNRFDVSEDNEFYYNGRLYTLTQDDIDNGSVVVEGETLTYDSEANELVSSSYKEFYTFHLDIEVKSDNTYIFSQELCYKYSTIEGCNVDTGDTDDITKGIYSHNFFYGFLPFYDDSITFEYVYFNLTFVNKNDSSDVITINEIGFDTSRGETINYKDSFNLQIYDYGYNSINNGVEYIRPLCLYDDYLAGIRVYSCDNYLYLTLFLETYSYNLVELRDYKITFQISVGESYNEVYTVNNDDIFLIHTDNGYAYATTFDGYLNNTEGYLFYIPLDNIEYSYSESKLGHTSFKLDVKYVCENKTGSDCSDSRSNDQTISKIYHLNMDNPDFDMKVSDGVELPSNAYYHFAGTNEVVVKSSFTDFNGIYEIGYFISRNANETNLDTKTYTNVSLGEDVSVSGSEGVYYLFYRVRDNSLLEYHYFRIKILIDSSAPSITSNNFGSYDENESYSNVEISIGYQDNYLDNLGNVKIASKAYYKVIKDENKNSITIEDVVSDNVLYSNKVVLNKDNISEDGKYLVCFVLEDYLGNKSEELICSKSYYIDVTALTKDEVSAITIEGYVSVVKTVVTISGVADGVSFKCGLSRENITSEIELSNTCYNGVETSLKVNDEAIYKLWIYAPDGVGNYALIKLDNDFYIDSLAPRIEKTITGDPSVYSGNVIIDVSAIDINDIDESKLSYEFYLATYDENKFESFSLEEGIKYPYDYYGSYKLAIKVCDNLNNCKVYTEDTSYLIDTSKITISLIGNERITILQYQKYVELGAIASKGNAGKNSIKVDYTIVGEVDNKKPGTYKIVYYAGEGVNRVEVEREIVVKKSYAYIIVLMGLFTVGEVIILARLFIKKRKNDNI